MSILPMNLNSQKRLKSREERKSKRVQKKKEERIILPLQGISILQREATKNLIIRTGVVIANKTQCDSCGGEVCRSHSLVQKYVDIPEDGLKSELRVEITTHMCKKCNKKQAFIPVSLLRKRRLTKRAIQYILSEHGMTMFPRELGNLIGVSEKTIRNIRKEYKDF